MVHDAFLRILSHYSRLNNAFPANHEVGWESVTPKSSPNLRSESRDWAQVMSCFATNSFHADSSLSPLILISTSRSLGYFLVNSLSSGTDARHGGHQVAQKSRITVLPANSLREICFA